MIYALILAGGKGSRLYPLSRLNKPKQFLKSENNNSFLVNTVDRIRPFIKDENIYVVTNDFYKDQIRKELDFIDDSNIFTEPQNKETATCIGLSAIKLLKKDKDAVIIALPSDHYIEDEDKYLKVLKEASYIANRRRGIVTLGIKPTRAETGYGYIEIGDRIINHEDSYKVARFTEKPNGEVAKTFLEKGNYLWNSGMFVFRADVILREIEKYIPKIYKSLSNIYINLDTEHEKDIIKSEYEKIEGISIDFGIMQKTRKAYVIKCDFRWDDIGSFHAFSRFLMQNHENKFSNNVYLEECKNCSVFGKNNLIIGIGLKDIVVVDAGDVILVMDKDKDQDIKHVLKKISNIKDYTKYI